MRLVEEILFGHPLVRKFYFLCWISMYKDSVSHASLLSDECHLKVHSFETESDSILLMRTWDRVYIRDSCICGLLREVPLDSCHHWGLWVRHSLFELFGRFLAWKGRNSNKQQTSHAASKSQKLKKLSLYAVFRAFCTFLVFENQIASSSFSKKLKSYSSNKLAQCSWLSIP
jgi:hypothetical protein